MFNRQLWAQLLRDVWRLLKRHPWMATPAVVIWRVMTTEDERRQFIAEALREDG